MSKFKDKAGDEWSLALDTGTLGKLRRDADFVLTKASFSKELMALDGDPFKLGAVLWTLCAEQAKPRNLDEEAFAFRFDGDTIERSLMALFEAAVDFFLPAKARETFRKKLPAILARTEQEAEHLMDRETERLLKMPVGSLLESAALTPTP